MNCPSCQTETVEGAKFCPACGASLPPPTVGCPKCATELPSDAKFCPECGNNMSAETKPEAAPKANRVQEDYEWVHAEGDASRDNRLKERAPTRFAEWLKAAEGGMAGAGLLVSYCYAQEGWGVETDYEKSDKWNRKAAEQGDARAQAWEGEKYYGGLGVEEDDAEAVKWTRKAAEQGYAPGQCLLGKLYLKGIGVTKDHAEAVKWYRKAAEQGNAFAQCSLGNRYYNGEGVTKDHAEAVSWYRKAAKQGFERAKAAITKLEQQGGAAVKPQRP